MTYKRLIPCIFIREQKAVKWFDDAEVIHESPVELAKYYAERGADELIVFDLSNDDEEHDETIDIMKRICREIQIPMVAGGNIKCSEDVKKFLYAGAKKVILNLAKSSAVELIAEVSLRFGKDKISVSLNDFDALFKQKHLIEQYCSEIVFMNRLDLNSVVNFTKVPCIMLTDTAGRKELIEMLKCPGVKGLTGRYVSRLDMDFGAFKEECEAASIKMESFDCDMKFSEFQLNSDGLIPVIVQNYKTEEVLMMAYMNQASFEQTLKTGKMTYFSRSRQCLWVKGETSGHYQYLKSISVDCDNDTLLAKVNQVGAACHTGNRSCFFRQIVGEEYDEKNPRQVFEHIYDIILDRKENPKEGSYTNYLFEKGIDKILKKVGEEATELVIAAKNPNPEEIKYELSDFLYHAMVLMVEKGVTWEDVIRELANR